MAPSYDGGVRERLAHQPEARGVTERARLRKLREHAGIVVRVDHDADVRPVLGRGAHHRRAADVDVLDRVLERAAGLGDRRAERVEIDHDEIDRRDAVLAQRGRVLGQVAPREDARVHLGVQRLHAAVEHLRKAGVGADVGDREARRRRARARCRRSTGARCRARQAPSRIRRGRACPRPTAAPARTVHAIGARRACA